jgi:hypothetical protein
MMDFLTDMLQSFAIITLGIAFILHLRTHKK